jgi:predicted DsbA family dithiol-disulfide isomerase
MEWHAFELRPKGSPPLPPEYLKRIEAARPRLLQIARETYGLDLKPGPTGIDSRPALIGAKYAEANSKPESYHAAMFRAYWQESKHIDDKAVLAEIAQTIGLDSVSFLAALDDPEYENAVDADIERAYQYGLNGVPALIFNNKYLVSGAQPYEVLRQVVEKVGAETNVT